MTTLPRSRPLPRADLEQVPDDGHHYELAEDTALQPDVLVARVGDLSGRDLPVGPLRTVEVPSQSTRRIDLDLERARYQAAGCPSYWAVDPDEPSLTALELQRGEYVEHAQVGADETLAAQAPFAVSVTPSRLVG